jgi:hypothetical protein
MEIWMMEQMFVGDWLMEGFNLTWVSDKHLLHHSYFHCSAVLQCAHGLHNCHYPLVEVSCVWCRYFEPRKLCTIIINIEMILFLFFFFRPLCCLSFNLRIMITTFVSSNSSYLCYECYLFIIYDLLYKWDSFKCTCIHVFPFI